ncbi:MAG: hypothetical protein SWY16_09040 [Cyanobacteriota bacterium]|nr:hypothetical protein [Cyanobacteriota bacterium]
MSNFIPNAPNWGQVISVNRCDRWSIHYRLRELGIPSACPLDGTLRVEIDCPVALILVRSVVRQFAESRQVSLEWLERCWETKVACRANS